MVLACLTPYQWIVVRSKLEPHQTVLVFQEPNGTGIPGTDVIIISVI